MRHSEHDENLAEVRAILGRLQRISRTRSPGDARAAGEDAASRALRAKTQDGSSPAASIPRFATAALVAVPLLAVVAGAGIVVVLTGNRQPDAVVKTPPPDGSPQSAAAEDAPAQGRDQPTPNSEDASNLSRTLQLASELMASGHVRAARAALLRITQNDSADVAWALARSYDPNHLATIAAPDAGPDITEATRWYRTWYDIAVKQGQVSDSVSLERVIRAMTK